MNGEFVHGYRVYDWEVVEANFTGNDFIIGCGDASTYKIHKPREFATPKDLINSLASRAKNSGIREYRASATPIMGAGDVMLFWFYNDMNAMFNVMTLTEYARQTTRLENAIMANKKDIM